VSSREFSWLPSEKKAARADFEGAFKRECEAIRHEVEVRLKRSKDPSEIWRVHDYLTAKRDEMDRKYDYRYSILIGVFGRLLRKGWIAERDLSALRGDKVEAIKFMASI
jgi:hypothetical protein